MRVTLNVSQIESCVIAMENAILDAELRGHPEPPDPHVRLRALPNDGVGVTVIIQVPGMPVTELRELLFDRMGRTLTPPPVRKVEAPGGAFNGMRAKPARA